MMNQEEAIKKLDELHLQFQELSKRAQNQEETKIEEWSINAIWKKLYYQSDIDWPYCRFEIFKQNINTHKSEYFAKFPDATESNFWYSIIGEQSALFYEHHVIGDYYDNNTIETYYWIEPDDRGYFVPLYSILEDDLKEAIRHTQAAKLEYCKQQIENEGNDRIKGNIEDQIDNIKSLQWKGTNIEIVEVIKGMIESKKISPELSEKEIFERFSQFLDIEIDQRKGLQNIKVRYSTGGKLNKFMEEMFSSLSNWYERLEERKSKNT